MLRDVRTRRASVIKLQKDASNAATYAIDFINLELATQTANPDPAHLRRAGRIHPAGRAERVRQGASGQHPTGVYLPAGQYPVTGKSRSTARR